VTHAPGRVLIAGTGLIGTSMALALRAKGAEVWLSDADGATARLAADLGAGTVVHDLRDAKGIADVAVLAMPPAVVGEMLGYAQECAVADVYTDVASVKVLPVQQARKLGCDLETYVPGHPLAGRERQGPAAAQADLFLGRTWAICPLEETSAEAIGAVTALAIVCGANRSPRTRKRMTAGSRSSRTRRTWSRRDGGAARTIPRSRRRAQARRAGLRDVTRIAAGDSALWTQILAANAGPVAEVVAAVAEDLAEVARLLATGTVTSTGTVTGTREVTALLDRGRAGVARIPGKHGGQQRNFTVVQVVIADRPGELARLFNAAGAARVNIEDVRIEHSPGLPVGVAELSIRPNEVPALLDAMEAGGWPVRR